MNVNYRVVLALVIFVLAPKFACASQWDEYSTFMDQFYYLDNQNFNNISCKVIVSNINNSLEQVRAQLKPLDGKIKVVENISDFSIIFGRRSGLKLNLPYFDVRLISDEGIKDRNKVETGIKYMKDGMQQAIDGTAEMIQGLFDEYISPKEDNIKIDHISNDSGVIKINYGKSGINIIDTYSGYNRKSKQISAAMESLSNETFKKIKNKLIIESAEVDITQAGSSIHMSMSIDYQELKDIIFPARIFSRHKFIAQDMQQQAAIDISFQSCEVK